MSHETEEVDFEEEEEKVEGGLNSKREPTESTKKSEKSNKIKVKGRGHSQVDEEDRYDGRGGVFESISQEKRGPSQCKYL